MEMDCNQFFQVLRGILGRSLKIDYGLFFLREKPSYFLPDVVRAISCYKTGSLSNI